MDTQPDLTHSPIDLDEEKVDKRRAPKKKATILDAAEATFVRRGFYGTSLRDISSAAKVPLALLSYHFGSKEGLFRAVIERRAAVNAAGMREALERTATRGSRESRLEAVLRAFIEPIVERSMRGGPGWKNYIRLLGQVANMPQEAAFVSPFAESYEATVQSFIASIAKIYPNMSNANLQWAFHFFQAAITHILIEPGLIDRQTAGACRSSDLDTMVPKLVQFCAAGFGALARGRT